MSLMVGPLRDRETDWSRVTLELTEALDDSTPENFATSGSIIDAANPGLYVKDLGTIGLPLSDRDAKDLIRASHRALGTLARANTDIRVNKTWELDSNRISLRNPQWQKTLSKVLTTVAKDFGLAMGSQAIQAKLHKLLLYTEGALVTPQKEAKTGLGTLMIALPSPHRGGSVTANVNGQIRHLNTDKRSDHEYSYLAWCAGAKSSVDQVTSGYRLVLTYKLKAPETSPLPVPKALVLGEKVARVGEILEEWQTLRSEFCPTGPMSLAYTLEHQYIGANLRAGLLKDRDREKCNIFSEACNAQGCRLYLALLNCSINGACQVKGGSRRVSDDGGSDYDFDDCIMTDEEDYNIDLGIVCDENGEEVAKGFYLPRSHVVQEDAFDDDPDEKKYRGRRYDDINRWATYYYHQRACLFVLPQCDYVNFVFNSEQTKDPTLASWVARLPKSNIADLEQICSRVLLKAAAKWESKSSQAAFPTNETLETIAGVSLAQAWPAVFSRITPFVEDALSPNIYRELGRVVAQNGFSKWQRAIETTFSSFASIRLYLDAADNMVEGYKACATIEQSDLLYLEDIRDNVTTKLDNAEHDLETLSLILPRKELSLDQKIVPFLKTRISHGNNIVRLLNQVKCSSIALEPKRQAYSDILHEFAGHFKLDYLGTLVLDQTSFVDLLSQSLAFDVKEPVTQIFEKIEASARIAEHDSFDYCILPFMKLIIPIALKDSRSFSNLFCSLVDACLHRFIGEEPLKPTDWTKRASVENTFGCSCKHCAAVNEFLLDPSQKRMRLEKFNQKDKKHLIACSPYDCVVEADRTVSPHALVLTKFFYIWRRDHDSWCARRDTVNDLLSKVDPKSMKKLLGDQHDRLISGNEIKLPPGRDHPDPLSNLTLIQTKQQVEEKEYEKPQKPQPEPRKQVSQKRPFAETQGNNAVDAKKPRLKDRFSFIDLTDE